MLSLSFFYMYKNRYMSITFILNLVLSLNDFLNIEIYFLWKYEILGV
jgi:hypothetical protein